MFKIILWETSSQALLQLSVSTFSRIYIFSNLELHLFLSRLIWAKIELFPSGYNIKLEKVQTQNYHVKKVWKMSKPWLDYQNLGSITSIRWNKKIHFIKPRFVTLILKCYIPSWIVLETCLCESVILSCFEIINVSFSVTWC